ncbi:hypothetical protein K402DRAFT_402031 [Aulographum hederae CBS 113979]|uniref:BZIP domain-containing protein n=1 Tax=Aulographum hederae CBS 113979 TaxID=1176131 RepID=A0A6G1H849_9PEZI|nr:hypothetical protein K402DRAFT_402031 [Aulographum hederae CBS 113979]
MFMTLKAKKPSDIPKASQQQPWLPSAAPPASRQQQSTPQQYHPQEDFVLFDTPAPAPTQHRRPSVPASHPTFNQGQPQLHANTAPNFGYRQTPILNRPPVPLFPSNSTGNIPQNRQRSSTMTGKATSSLMSQLRLTPPTASSDFDDLINGLGDFSGANDTPGADVFGFADTTDNSFNFTAINSGGHTGPTVSPKDVFNGDFFGSAPQTSASAFTNITTPDTTYDTSPLFENNGDLSATDNWFPLFPTEPTGHGLANDHASANVMTRNVSQQSLGDASVSSNSPLTLSASMHRSTSSNDNSPLTFPASISKSRRRKGPLPEIKPDPSDKVAVKRARNTLAARESRARKLSHVQTLEARLADAEAERDAWRRMAMDRGAPDSLN